MCVDAEPEPEPVVPRLTFDEIPLAEIAAGSSVLIQITSVYSHCSVFIRSIELDEEFNETIDLVKVAAENAPSLYTIPGKNELVLAPFEEEFYRALVLEQKDSKLKVAFIDYGNTEWVNFTDLKHINDDLLKHRRHAVRVNLKSVQQLITDDDANNMFAVLKGFEYNICRVISKERMIRQKSFVELIKNNISINESVNAKLIRCYLTMLNTKSLNCRDVTVRIIDVSKKDQRLISCVLQSEFRTHIQQLRYIYDSENLLLSQPIYRARVNELCMVRIARTTQEREVFNWYRAEVKAVKNNGKLLAELIDVGSTEIVEAANIRQITDLFMTDVFKFDCFVKKSDSEDASKIIRFAKAKGNSIEKRENSDFHVIDFDWQSFVFAGVQ